MENKAEIRMGINISDGNTVDEYENHGGFHGDGITFKKVDYSETDYQEIVDKIKENEDWKPLPLSKNLNWLIYGEEDDDDENYGYVFRKDNDGKNLFPNISNGYYFFYDRHSENENNPHDDTDLLNRYSYNFTVAIYDTDNNILYYGELDT